MHQVLALANVVAPVADYAAMARTGGVSRKTSPRVMMAQAMRAFLLARATAATLKDFLTSNA